MQTFTPVDSTGRLWQVTDLLPPEQAQQFASTRWLELDHHVSNNQELWLRRQIDFNQPRVKPLNQMITQQLPAINQALATTFKRCAGFFWIDFPGFTCNMHTDGHLPNSMQLYWSVPGPDYGTGFYQYKRSDSLIYQFDSRPNSGYIMLNHANQDGSQPLQWHGMFRPVPAGSIRVSSYWQFE